MAHSGKILLSALRSLLLIGTSAHAADLNGQRLRELSA